MIREMFTELLVSGSPGTCLIAVKAIGMRTMLSEDRFSMQRSQFFASC